MFSHYPLHANNCTLYPGEYVPMHNAELLSAELKKSQGGSALQPFINVSEHDHYYMVEMAIPGLNREDFVINIDDDLLSITVLHKPVVKNEGKQFRLHEFNYECFNRVVHLPENTEKEFVNAEYKNGILSLCLPKTKVSGQHPHTSVIVY